MFPPFIFDQGSIPATIVVLLVFITAAVVHTCTHWLKNSDELIGGVVVGSIFGCRVLADRSWWIYALVITSSLLGHIASVALWRWIKRRRLRKLSLD